MQEVGLADLVLADNHNLLTKHDFEVFEVAEVLDVNPVNFHWQHPLPNLFIRLANLKTGAPNGCELSRPAMGAATPHADHNPAKAKPTSIAASIAGSAAARGWAVPCESRRQFERLGRHNVHQPCRARLVIGGRR